MWLVPTLLFWGAESHRELRSHTFCSQLLMRSIRRLLVIGASVAIAAPVAQTAQAQAPNSGTVLHVTPYAGYMVFGNYLSGPLGTSVTNTPAPMYGTQVGLSLSPRLSLIGNVGYTSSSIQVGVPIFGGLSVGSSSILMYDGGLEYNLGSAKEGGSALSPFVQAGVGAMQYNINASILNTQATNLTGNIGAGADFSVGRNMALRVMAKDYIGKFNFQDATGFNVNGPTANNFALMAGLRLDF